MKNGMKWKLAIKLDKQARIFKEQMKVLKKGKIEYFWASCNIWSIQHFIFWSTNMFRPIQKNKVHTVFYNTINLLVKIHLTME